MVSHTLQKLVVANLLCIIGVELTELELLNVKAVDTLGAGVVIHGAFCYFYYMQKQPFDKALKLASQVATPGVSQKGVVNGLNYAINHLF